MRKTIIAGLVLALATVGVMGLSALFDLELESTALLGAAVGAVLALVPDRSLLVRFIGFAAGFLATWFLYLVRAGLLPDTWGGDAVFAGLVLLVCVAVVAISVGRVPLWSTLLGTIAMVGGYEYAFVAAKPEAVSTSVTAATSLVFCIAVGFLVAAIVAPTTGASGARPPLPRENDEDPEHTTFDDLMMMENTK